MPNRRFLYCRDCNAIHRVTVFDTAPFFEIDGLNVREVPQDDRRDFLNLHLGHRIGELNSIGEIRDEGDDGNVDPMKVSYVEVTDGREIFIVRSSRRSIADPLFYEVMPRQWRFWEFVDERAETGARTGVRYTARRRTASPV
jgi:hypothetical protein